MWGKVTILNSCCFGATRKNPEFGDMFFDLYGTFGKPFFLLSWYLFCHMHIYMYTCTETHMVYKCNWIYIYSLKSIPVIYFTCVFMIGYKYTSWDKKIKKTYHTYEQRKTGLFNNINMLIRLDRFRNKWNFNYSLPYHIYMCGYLIYDGHVTIHI